MPGNSTADDLSGTLFPEHVGGAIGIGGGVILLLAVAAVGRYIFRHVQSSLRSAESRQRPASSPDHHKVDPASPRRTSIVRFMDGATIVAFADGDVASPLRDNFVNGLDHQVSPNAASPDHHAVPIPEQADQDPLDHIVPFASPLRDRRVNGLDHPASPNAECREKKE